MFDVGVLLTGIVRGTIYGLMAAGFSLIFGVTDICDFSYGQYAMLGSYIAYFTYVFTGSPFLAVILAIIGTFIIGIVSDLLVITPVRGKSPDWIRLVMINTIGLSIFLENFALVVWTPDYRSATYFEGSLKLPFMVIGLDRLYAFIMAIVLFAAIYYFLNKTMMGKAFMAISQDAEAAKMMGINVDKYYTLSHGIGAMLAGAAGGLLLPIFMAYPTVGLPYIIISFAVVIFGGFGSIEGSIVAGLLLGITEAIVTAVFTTEYADFVAYVVIMVVLLLRPSGLLGRVD